MIRRVSLLGYFLLLCSHAVVQHPPWWAEVTALCNYIPINLKIFCGIFINPIRDHTS